MSEVVIKVENLWKQYHYGTISHATLKKDFQSWWARFRGKEDPNLPIDHVRGTKSNASSSPMRYSQSSIQETSDRFWALEDITFDVKQGEILGIIGKNGAGKSTLLKIISRVTTPTKGQVKIKGRIASLLEVGTGFHPELTGRENIFLNGAILGMNKAEIKRKFDEIVNFAEVEKFIDTPVKRYSSGMYVRLAFGVAAHLNPDILVADEVLAVGDAAFQKKCLCKMGDVAKGGRTVLFVSHQMAAVQNLCKNAILLNYGKVTAKDKTKIVIEKYLKESSSLSQIELSERKDRQGTGDIRFTSVILQDDKGETVRSFHSGQNVRIIFCYENNIHQDLNNFIFAAGIDNQMGDRVTHLSNEVSAGYISNLSSKVDRIELYIENLPLTLGRYYFTIYSTINGEVADWVQNAGFFDVEAGDFYGTGKLLPMGQGNFLVKHGFMAS